ncbi:LysR family transcriptional regulator ArgP [Alkalimarinus alittae]|uniref:LysR family transcriptional regulator ArgP n=1 Tax=Alkalimarinus alittae TaxID=2961619 RepID=A0ABY6N2F7_9ALTE|nr:LysR family transcriptional regulator ArgP [Alkalimarinus alittae]UZE96296.1 LysR family transcriptional regulator ArgP [Alkalimarinus alittae]
MSIEIPQLEAVAQIIDAQSFEKAAERLCITQSAISQRLRQLETQLGQRLIIRSSPPTLTSAGVKILKYYRQVSHLQEDLLSNLAGNSDDGIASIAIGSNADSLATWLLDALTPLLKNGKTFVEIHVDDQDRTHDLLRDGTVVGCISASSAPIQGCNCIPLGIMTYRCLVSPDYKARYFPSGINKASILAAPCVEFSHSDDLQRQYLTQYFGGGYPQIRHRVPSTESFLEFITRGFGWGMVPDVQSQKHLNEKRVIELVEGNTLDIPLYWHIWNLRTTLSRTLTDSLRDEAAKVLSPI